MIACEYGPTGNKIQKKIFTPKNKNYIKDTSEYKNWLNYHSQNMHNRMHRNWKLAPADVPQGSASLPINVSNSG